MNTSLLRFGLLSGFCAGSLLIAAKPSVAAERVTLTYGFAEISTSVEALSAYAETGAVDEELAPYIRFLNEEQRSQFRVALNAKQDANPVAISQFLYSSIGSNILRYMGDIIQTQGRRTGSKGLRGALVLAAAEPGGISLLGVLENFPTNAVRIDSRRAFQAFGAFTQLIQNTELAIAAIEKQAAPAQLIGVPSLPDLAQTGPQTVTAETFTITDVERDRAMPIDLYLPETPNAPLIVFSHGLAGDRKGFAPMIQHLASHGYAVAALDHPGSNTEQFIALLSGSAREIAKPTEFTERPRDVSYLLDELTRRNEANGILAGRLNMSKVGIIGHSFGGYTALALAGAKLNFNTLKSNCESPAFIYNAANPSMLLQCTALLAPEQFEDDLRDDRIQAVMAINPVTSSLFGPAGFAQIAIPSLLVSGTGDPIAPALLEQIRPFTWLNRPRPEGVATPDHFLALIQGGSHLYDPPEIDGNTDIALANELINADIPLAYSYLKAMSLGFMEAEVNDNAAYKAAFADASIVQIGQPPLPLYIVETLTEAMLRPVPAAPAVIETVPSNTAIPPEPAQ